jgi:tetratricopeptide (TPR) repeat protein
VELRARSFFSLVYELRVDGRPVDPCFLDLWSLYYGSRWFPLASWGVLAFGAVVLAAWAFLGLPLGRERPDLLDPAPAGGPVRWLADLGLLAGAGSAAIGVSELVEAATWRRGRRWLGRSLFVVLVGLLVVLGFGWEARLERKASAALVAAEAAWAEQDARRTLTQVNLVLSLGFNLEDPGAHVLRGDALAGLGELDRAMDAFEQALLRDPRNAKGLAGREAVRRRLDERRR